MSTRANRKESPNADRSDLTKEAMPNKGAAGREQDYAILPEIRKLRKEHSKAAKDNKNALSRLESNLKELVERTTSLEQRTVEMEEILGETEDRAARLERSFFTVRRC